MGDDKQTKLTSEEQNVLAAVRKEIDRIDEEILELLNRRARVSRRVGRIKSGGSGQVFKPRREKLLFEKLEKKNEGPLPNDHLRSIFREIISSSRSLQKRLKVVYLGPEGTFSHFTALEFLGSTADFTPRPNLEGVFASIHSGKAQLGIVPLENSMQGSVGQTLDLFRKYDVHVQAEIYSRVSHSLLSSGGELSSIREVHSHPKALEQCQSWLQSNLPNAAIFPAESTAAAARTIQGVPQAAAIGHWRLAEMENLNILAQPIEDLPDNWTRFLVITTHVPVPEGNDKTSILFTTSNEPGSLADILSILAEAGINLTKLESRPIATEKWKYVFFADLECELVAEDYKPALKKLTKACSNLRILGCYPKGPHLDVRKG